MQLLLQEQRYKFFSNSQLDSVRNEPQIGCYCKSKDTNFSAIHNFSLVLRFRGVGCYCKSKDTNFSAIHNDTSAIVYPSAVVIARAKIQIFQQFTTDLSTPSPHLSLLLQEQRYKFFSTPEKADFAKQIAEAKEKRGLVRDNLDKVLFRIVTPVVTPVEETNIRDFAKQNLQGEHYWHGDKRQKVYVNQKSTKKFATTYNGMKADRDRAVKEGRTEDADKLSKEMEAYRYVLSNFDDVFNASELVETHNDFADHNAVYPNEDVSEKSIVHRLYSAMSDKGNVFAVKFMVQETASENETNPLHAYEITDIELTIPSATISDNVKSSALSTGVSSISGSKLLEKFDKTKDPGVKLLDASKKESELQSMKLQLAIIKDANPKDSNLSDHAWIESVDDIKTFDEAIKNFAGTPDYTMKDAEKALRVIRDSSLISYSNSIGILADGIAV